MHLLIHQELIDGPIKQKIHHIGIKNMGIIMIDHYYHHMASKQHSTREIDQATTKNHSIQVDYSLSIMVAVLMMLERVEMQPGMAPAVCTPPIFAFRP
jgi:hypothetical protein